MTAAVLTLGATGTLSACGGGGGGGGAMIRAENAALGTNPGASAALYVELTNPDGEDDTLLGATCECADRTSLHVTEDRDGILMMVSTEELTIPAGETVELDPGRSHVMLEQLAEPLEVGDTVEVSLDFDHSRPVILEVPVIAPEDLAERIGEDS